MKTAIIISVIFSLLAIVVLVVMLTVPKCTSDSSSVTSESFTTPMNTQQYFQSVYPEAKRYIPEYWKRLSLNFFYACAPQEIADSYGGIVDGLQTNYVPPELGAAWVPIWFAPGSYAINQYPPQKWWEYPHADGFDCGDWVELMHGVDDNPYYTVYGYWGYYTKGSGVWYNLGTTLRARNKLHALQLLGVSRDDIAKMIQNTNYMTNATTPYKTIQSLADSLFKHTAAITPLSRVKLLIDVAANPGKYTGLFTTKQLYAADRANNSADWDGDIVTLAWTHGYDSVQFTVQANGNGGWAHEFVFCGMDPVEKDVEKTWAGWPWVQKRMAIGEPGTFLPMGSCTFDPATTEYTMVTCQEQSISNQADCVGSPPTPYPSQ